MGLTNKNSLQELMVIYEAMDIPPAIIQQQPQFSSNFINYLKKVENPKKVGFRNNLWFPFRVSSTEIDIGYGHKINPGEMYNKGLNTQQIEQLLIHDLKTAELKTKTYLNHEYGKNTFENLDKSRQEMLIDFAFNLGSLNKFPKFIKAVIYNDISGMKNEYIRTAIINGIRKPISRNEEFFNNFLKNYKGGYFINPT